MYERLQNDSGYLPVGSESPAPSGESKEISAAAFALGMLLMEEKESEKEDILLKLLFALSESI